MELVVSRDAVVVVVEVDTAVGDGLKEWLWGGVVVVALLCIGEMQ